MSSILKLISGVVIVVVVVLTGLHGIKGSPSVETTTKYQAAVAKLEAERDEYGKCSRSVNGLGASTVSTIELSYWHEGMSRTESDRLSVISEDFMKQVHKDCDPVIKQYEGVYEIYKTIGREIAESELSLYDKIIGIKPDDSSYDSYSPSIARMNGAGYSFGSEDVRKYFESKL